MSYGDKNDDDVDGVHDTNKKVSPQSVDANNQKRKVKRNSKLKIQI